MIAAHRIAFRLAMTLALLAQGACAIPEDGDDGVGSVATQRSAIENPDNDPDPEPGPDGDDSDPPRDPRVPRRPGLSTVRVSLLALNVALPAKLAGTRISLDASGHAPGLHQPGDSYRQCSRDDVGYEEARKECLHLTSGRAACLRQAAQDYPLVCTDVPIFHRSYLAFPATLKTEYPALRDYLTDVDTFRSSTWAGDVDITLNQISATLDGSTTSVHAGRNLKGANIALRIHATSPQPTAYCRHTNSNPLLFCPDLQLTNMVFALRLESLGPSSADPRRVGFGPIETILTFDSNINNFPDAIVAIFADIDARIRARTEAKVRTALADPARHDAVERALDTVITSIVRSANPGFTGFGAIDEVTYYEGDLYVHYTAP